MKKLFLTMCLTALLSGTAIAACDGGTWSDDGKFCISNISSTGGVRRIGVKPTVCAWQPCMRLARIGMEMKEQGYVRCLAVQYKITV